MISTGTDILWRIAEFITPNPIVYCKLALVNRDFYRVFTSDKVWQVLDPYNVQTDIISSFYTACDRSPSDYGLLSLVWWRYVDWDAQTIRKFTNNKFVWLGYLVYTCTKESWLGFEEYSKLIKCVFDIDPTQYIWTCESIRLNFDYTLYAVQAHGPNYGYIPEEFEENNILVNACLNNGCLKALEGQDLHLMEYKDLIKACFDKDKDSIVWMAHPLVEIFNDDREMILKIVAQYPWVLPKTGKYLQDYDVCMQAVTAKEFQPMLEHVPERFRDDETLVTAAVECSGSNIIHASERLRYKHSLMLTAIKKWYLATKSRVYDIFATYSRDDLSSPDLMVAIACRSGATLSELPAGCDIYEVVLAAVSNHGQSIRLASGRLKRNKTLALTAINQTYQAYKYISPDLKDDRDILEAAVKQNGGILSIIPIELHDIQLVQLAVKNTGAALEFAPVQYRDHREIVEIAVSNYFGALEFASKSLQHNKNVLTAAFEKHRGDHEKIPAELLANREFMRPIIEKNGTDLPELLEDREYSLLTVIADPRSYRKIPKKFKKEFAFNLEAVQRNGHVFNEIDGDMVYDKAIQAAIR